MESGTKVILCNKNCLTRDCYQRANQVLAKSAKTVAFLSMYNEYYLWVSIDFLKRIICWENRHLKHFKCFLWLLFGKSMDFFLKFSCLYYLNHNNEDEDKRFWLLWFINKYNYSITFKNLVIARTHCHTKICPTYSHNLCEMRLNESLYQLLVPFWNKDQANEKWNLWLSIFILLYIYTPLRQQNWEYPDDVWYRNLSWSNTITCVSVRPYIKLIDSVLSPLLDWVLWG